MTNLGKLEAWAVEQPHEKTATITVGDRDLFLKVTHVEVSLDEAWQERLGLAMGKKQAAKSVNPGVVVKQTRVVVDAIRYGVALGTLENYADVLYHLTGDPVADESQETLDALVEALKL